MQARAILPSRDFDLAERFLLLVFLVSVASCGGRLGSPSDAGTGLDAADAQMPGVACSGPQDCTGPQLFQPGPGVACCVAGTCIFGAQAAKSSCGVPDAQVIAAANYDLSCTVDTDCALVALGDFCSPTTACATGAISQGALPKYKVDVAKTYAAHCVALSGCGLTVGCCRNGQCVADACFPQPGDTLPACADAGGKCQNTGTLGVQAACTGPGAGPPDWCAYADETCCLTSP